MEEKDSPPTYKAESSLESSVNLAEGSDFCLLGEDDIEMEDTGEGLPRQSTEDFLQTPEDTSSRRPSTVLDVETMKRKADEIACSLRKLRSNRTSDSSVPSQDYEPPEELKRYRERSAFVALKLKEDRLLFEESKKRNEAVVDKVRTVKQIHKNISESTKELKRDDSTADETMALRLKIERLEASLSHLQNTLTSKNQIIFENKETIRTLNESINDTRANYLDYVEHSQEEIQQLRDEHVKALEKITNSRDEFHNQLQTVRKKCLLMENDLKLSEFARFRLVSKNAELRERVSQLETELKIPHTKSISLEDIDEEKSEIPLNIAASDLYPKIECLTTITNEFCSYLVNSGGCNFEDAVQPDNCDPLQNMDQISDRLESVFYVVRDKLSDFVDLENHTKGTEEKLRQLEAIIEENRNQDAKLKKILATMKAKIQSETNINKDLMEQLSKAQETIRHLEQSSEQDLILKCQELERANQHLQHELNALQNALTAREPSSQLLETVDHLKRELGAKIQECEKLRHICEELEDTNDKLENDFVVLRTRDCDEEEHWKVTCARLEDENGKLLENTRHMTARATEYENERLSLYREIDELRQTVNNLTDQLEFLNKQSFVVQDAKIEHDSEMQAEIENLSTECDVLSRELNEVQKQLAYEASSNRDLQEQIELVDNTNATLSHEILDLQERNQELEAVKITLENNIVELRKRLESAESEGARLQQYIKSTDETLSNCERTNQERDAELEYLKNYNVSLLAQVEKLNAEKEAMAAKWTEYEKKMADDEVNVEALRRANEELTSSVRQLRQTMRELEDEKEQLASKYKHLSCQYEEQFNNSTSLLQDLESLKSQILAVENEKEVLLDQCEEYCNRIETLENEYAKIHSDSELQTRIVSLETEKQHLESECEKFKSKYQRLQLLCKANINKAVSEAKAEVEKYKTAWLEATRQQYSEGEELPVSRNYKADAEEWKTACLKVQDELAKAQKHQVELKNLEEVLNLELESWKYRYNELNNTLLTTQQEISSLKELVTKYEAELQKAQEAPIQTVQQTMRADDGQVLDVESAVDVVISECLRRTDKDVQKAVDEVVNECLLQTDELRNCITKLKDENHRLREQYKEMEHCQTKVSQLQEELQLVRFDYNNLEQRLYNMDEESGKEIVKYKELLEKADADSKSMEECLAETRNLLQQKERVYFEYQVQMEALMDAERSKYENQMADFSRQQRKSDTVNAAAQTDSQDASKTPPATISTYFDYYKGKITKEITNVLQPEEPPVDYSAWILPDSQDPEYQIQYQQVPAFGYDSSNENTAACHSKSSQTQVINQDQASQAEISHFNLIGQSLNLTAQTQHQTQEKRALSEIIDQLRELLLGKINGDDWMINESEWLSDELEIYNENFVSTSMKFVDLCEAIIQFYSTVPQACVMFDTLKRLFNASLPEREESCTQWNHHDSYHQMITLCTHLECENKYLTDAITFVEETILVIRPTVEIARFHDVMSHWRVDRNFEETDIIDRVCEEFDIIPTKFAPGPLFTTWKETMLKSLEPSVSAPAVSAQTEENTVSFSRIEPPLVTVMKKNHKLIGDLYYKYGKDKNFDPNEFFDQIDDINQNVERLVKFVKGEIKEIEAEEVVSPSAHAHTHIDDHHDHDHDHDHDHKHDHQHAHEDHHHSHHHEHSHEHPHEHPHEHHHEHDNENERVVHDDSKAVEELKQLLAESNRKIDSLVRELMEAKNSKDYNEMKQLHSKLDETLYHLHLRDVHNAELAQELTQLLTERDALQLKLSSVIRQYEELRQAFVSANKANDDSVPLPSVNEKLEELQKMNYMKDPRISEASNKYHAAGMQLFAEDSTEIGNRARDENTSGFSVPSLFKWITGDTESK